VLLLAALLVPASAARAACTPEDQVVLVEQASYDQGIGIDPVYDRDFQEFRLVGSSRITEVSVVVSRPDANTDRDLVLSLYSVDGSHEPDAPIAGTAVSRAPADVSTDVGWVSFTLPAPVALTAGQYAVVLELGAGSSSVGYHWWRQYDASDPYPAGLSGYWYPYAGGQWVTTDLLDDAFRVEGCAAAPAAGVPSLGPFGLGVLALLLASGATLARRRLA
jgi:hypothetical protein